MSRCENLLDWCAPEQRTTKHRRGCIRILVEGLPTQRRRTSFTDRLFFGRGCAGRAPQNITMITLGFQRAGSGTAPHDIRAGVLNFVSGRSGRAPQDIRGCIAGFLSTCSRKVPQIIVFKSGFLVTEA
jgi:hypothetical protein